MTTAARNTGWISRFGATSLGTKLAVVGALLAAIVVGGAFLALRISTEEHVRGVFVGELHASQIALRRIEAQNRRLLLQRAVLLSTSPPLHAALAAWRNEPAGGAAQLERRATIHGAVRDAFEGLDADLLVVTDDSGRVVTTQSTVGAPSDGTSLAALPAMHSALFSLTDSPDSTLGVVQQDSIALEIAAVPILEGGFPVGAVLLGERISGFIPVDVGPAAGEVVASDRRVLISSIADAPSGSAWHPVWRRVAGNDRDLIIGDAEYVTATVPLGFGEDGRPVDLYLLRSLSAATGPIEVALTRQFILAGILAVLLIGAGGAVLSRTTLRPLSRFVAFMQSGTGADGYARFDEAGSPAEITALTDSYNRLIESLRLGHEQLRQRTVDLAEANERLNRQITQRERVEQALRESEEQLRQAQKLEALGALAGGVAHDFNNILSIILGYAEIVRAELAPTTTQHADVGKITDAAVRARTLVRQLLAFSRKQVLQPQILDLNHVVTGVEPLLRPLIGEAIVLEVKLAPDLAHVTADPGQIEQVIMNLAVNARDAMPNGGRLVIETANIVLDDASGHQPLPAGPVVMLAVADSGIGMDAATRRRIFEPFFTTKPVGKGTGLGLATVYGIVRQSDGNITVFSEPGEGTTFRCYFPPVLAPELAPAAAAAAPGPLRGAETILIAEDELELRELMRRALERQGYHVITASDGAVAVEMAAQHTGPIHLLVTDVVMPVLSGSEVAQRLMADRPGLRVMFISGYSTEAIDRHGVLAPDSVFLQKPVAPDALSHAVRELLDSELPASAR